MDGAGTLRRIQLCVGLGGSAQRNCGFGSGSTSVRFLVSYQAEGAPARIRGLLLFGRAFTLIVACLFTACSWIVVLLVAGASPYVDALKVAFLAIPVLAFLNLEAAYARGFNWMMLATVAEQIGRPALLMVFGWLLVSFIEVPSAEAFVLACVLAYLVATMLQHRYVSNRISRAVGTGGTALDAGLWLRVSGVLLLLNGAQFIRMNTDLVLVGISLEPADVGVYTAAVRTATLVSFTLTVASVVAQPRLSSLHTEQRRAELAQFVATTTRWIFVASLVAGALLGALGKPVLALFEPEFVNA